MESICFTAPARRFRHVLLAAVGFVLLPSCASGGATGAAATPSTSAGRPSSAIAVTLDNNGCTALPQVATPGIVTLTISNRGGDKVDTLEVSPPLSPSIAEQDDITPGVTTTITMRMLPGAYLLTCPGATHDTTLLGVGGKYADWQANQRLAAGVARFTASLQQDAAALVSATQSLVAATQSGDMDAAQTAYPAARLDYERLASIVTRSPQFDGANYGGIDQGASGAGFGVVESAIWNTHSLAGAAPAAATLLQDVQKVASAADVARPAPADILNGAVASLTVAVVSGLSGGEEQFSGMTLAVIETDLDSAAAAYASLRDGLAQVAPRAVTIIDQRFANATAALAAYRATPGAAGTGFVDFGSVTASQRGALANTFNALSASLSAAVVLVL
ncbi:MAG: peptidase M75 family protein [Candidatus Dormibacteraeota bacterium]|nr:peptidase M75 family protein [Candidatus Dormibacteraeota bacterium]